MSPTVRHETYRDGKLVGTEHRPDPGAPGDLFSTANVWSALQTFTRWITTNPGVNRITGWRSTIENRLTDTTFSPFQIVATGIRSTVLHGSATVDARGSDLGISSEVNVLGSGSEDNEFAPYFGVVRMGTDTKAANGRAWLADFGVHGPIGLVARMLTGITMFMNNYADGSPTAGPGVAFIAVTKKGEGPAKNGAGHDQANTYPLDAGVAVVGRSRADMVDDTGWHRGVQVGGWASGWMRPDERSRIGTGVDISDFELAGIHVHDGHEGPAAIFEGDVEVVDGNIILTSPNGSRWRVTVSDLGVLGTTPA